MSERKCNGCTLCCKLLPVKEFGKPANERCVFVRAHKGCKIHHHDVYPKSCRLWSCEWLTGETTQSLPRPDRAHYVIDPSLDFVVLEGVQIPVVQIWVDPKHRDAHRDPDLRAWLEDRYVRTGQIAIVRFDSYAAICLFPPSFPGTGGQWFEKTGKGTAEHTPQEILEVQR